MLLLQAVDYDNHCMNTKYVVQRLLRDGVDSEMGKKFLAATDTDEIWYVRAY